MFVSSDGYYRPPMQRLCVVLLLAVMPLSLHADTKPTQENAGKVTLAARAVGRELQRWGRDSLSMARAPLQWDRAQWTRAGLGLGAVGLAATSDQPIADFVQRNRSDFSDDFSRVVTPFGGRRALVISAAMLAGGLVTHRPALRDTGRDAIEASILAAGMVTPLLKRAVGRSRPFVGAGAYDFHPFTENQSFPSGHATNAFAVASVVAGHAHGWIVPTVAYTLATGVAVSRMNDDVHFASDVLAGGLIGTAIGRGVVARHRTPTAKTGERTTIDFVPLPGGAAIQVQTSAVAIAGAVRRIRMR
jgi:membrane-associated phospholipid phosphatase